MRGQPRRRTPEPRPGPGHRDSPRPWGRHRSHRSRARRPGCGTQEPAGRCSRRSCCRRASTCRAHLLRWECTHSRRCRNLRHRGARSRCPPCRNTACPNRIGIRPWRCSSRERCHTRPGRVRSPCTDRRRRRLRIPPSGPRRTPRWRARRRSLHRTRPRPGHTRSPLRRSPRTWSCRRRRPGSPRRTGPCPWQRSPRRRCIHTGPRSRHTSRPYRRLRRCMRSDRCREIRLRWARGHRTPSTPRPHSSPCSCRSCRRCCHRRSPGCSRRSCRPSNYRMRMHPRAPHCRTYRPPR